MDDNRTTRRSFLRASLAVSAPLAIALGGGYVLRSTAGAQEMPSAEPTQQLELTPACVDDDDLDFTPSQTEGPYFTPNSPERTSLLEPGMPGTLLTVTGRVLSSSCQPVAGALIDFWQADDAGEYDTIGYRLRGHQYTDTAGRYTLETVVPGLYPGRTRHIHLKVQAPSAPVLTTQLYFPDEPRNARDGIYNARLLLAMQETDNGKLGRYDFVVATA